MRLRHSWFKSHRTEAILAVRNEQHYLQRCLNHLAEQEVSVCVIDNGSTDGSLDIARSFDPNVVTSIVQHPYPGYFDWEGILKLKQQRAAESPAHWFIHVDADEILESPITGKTLAEAIHLVNRKGFNAINFNEFVFVPSNDRENWDGRDYVAGMDHYYFFEPHPQRLIRAWKKQSVPVDIAGSGGHDIRFPGRSIYPQAFILRHYIALSRDYLIDKYCERKYSPHELDRGWHHNRIGITPDAIQWPASRNIETLPAKRGLGHIGSHGRNTSSRRRPHEEYPAIRKRHASQHRRPRDDARLDRMVARPWF
jgi:glycosyltransferase involved in cell wall biosynthesis